jgi:signal transduction histidine kinase
MKFSDIIQGSREHRNGAHNTLSGEDRAKDLELILNVVKTINHSLILTEVLELVLDNAIRVAHGERGFLLLTNQEGKLNCVLARDAAGRRLDERTATISRSVAEDVYTTGESVCIEHALADDRYDHRQSIAALELQTILCSPLTVRNEKIGVIYVDSRHIQSVTRDEIVDLFEILAGQAATAIKNAQLYEKLQKAFEDLQNANEHLIKAERLASKGEMAAEVSHELKNLVAVVLLQLQSLTRFFRKYSPEECEQKLNAILTSVQRIRDFASGLLESSALKINKQTGDINESLAAVVKSLQPLSRFHKAVFVTIFDETIPPFKFDGQQIQQVLVNLVANAVEAYGEATIGVQSLYDPARNQVRIFVKDNGPGISDEVKAKLFTEKITTKADGHGYGLPICRKIIENHQGTIQVESAPAHGTTFAISLPVPTS